MSRIYCPICSYPQKTCVCDVLEVHKNTKLCSQTKITILQDSTEVNSAKNTVRLLSLCLENIRVIVGKREDDFYEIRKDLEFAANSGEEVVVVYPSENSYEIETYSFKQDSQNNREASNNSVQLHLVFLDGTWRKAYRLWCINNWLHDYPCVFLRKVKAKYRIRKVTKKYHKLDCKAFNLTMSNIDSVTIKEDNQFVGSESNISVSTLEAVVYSLNICEPILDTKIAMNLFDKMQSFFPG